jgi:DNA recombination protein RmuC
MNMTIVILLTVAGLAIGAAIAWLVAGSRIAALGERKVELERSLESVQSRLTEQQAEVNSLLAAKSAAEATLESERRSTKEKLDLVNTASEEMKAQFSALATAALESSNASFLQLARGTLEKYQSEAKSELEKREQAVEGLVKPISDSLKQMDEHVRHLEQARAEAYGSLTSQVTSLLETQKSLQMETGNLVKALREPQARGRWGELQLRRALEFAGMLEYCDFEEQVSAFTIDSAGERHGLRPDVIVRLPGGKQIVIDAKVPMTEYLKALEAPDDKTRESHLAGHARQVREHVNALAAKAYWAQFIPTPEFVILFIPGEVFFRAAFMADPELVEVGASKVMLASPITLVAMLRTIAYAWNQQNLAESARKIGEAGKTLYQRLAVMGYHFQDIGKRLGAAVESYDKAVGSMERSVFPIARKLPELDRSLSTVDLPELQQIEKTPRRLASPDWQLQSEVDPFLLESEDADLREP